MDSPQINIAAHQTSAMSAAAVRFTAMSMGGDYRYVQSHTIRSDAERGYVFDVFAKAGVEMVCCNGGFFVSSLFQGSNAIVLVTVYEPNEWEFSVAGTSMVEAQKWSDAFHALCPVREEKLGLLPVSFWTQNPMGGASFTYREVESCPWSDVSSNYPQRVRASVGRLADLQGFDAGGKLILFHGPPGTGKTRAILSLTETWRPWANINVIVDPDRFFGDATYMSDLLMRMSPERWNLLVVEDGDEFMDASDAGRKGQDVGRLLNLNDGFLGQGLKIATLISTNVDMASFNSAVTRPGRCLANIEFPAFSAEEAALWMAEHDVAPDEGSMTLAQMYDKVRRVNSIKDVMARFDNA